MGTARPVRLDPATVGYVVGLGGCAVVAATLARGHAVQALLLACVFTSAVTAVAYPRPYRLLAAIMIVCVPFAVTVSLLQPQELDYPAYVAAFTLFLVVLGAFQLRAIPQTIGTLYLAYLVVAGVIGVGLTEGLGHVKVLTYILMAFAMYVLVWRGDERERRVIVVLLVAFGVVQSVLAVSQSVFGRPVFDAVLPVLYTSDRNYFAYFLPGVGTLVTQGSGTFWHFNFLGAVLALCVPLTFGLWLNNLRSAMRAAVFAITAAGLVATFSRGALLGALAGVVFILFFDRLHSRRAMIVLVACAAALAGLLAANTFAQYYESTQNVSIRMQTWQVAFGDALERPSNLLFGFGFDHFHGSVLAAGRGGLTQTVQSTIMASLHSGYLQILLEFGIAGTVLFVFWLVSVTRTGLGRARSRLTVTLLGACLGFLCHQAIDNSLFSYAGVLFVVAMALIEAEGRSDGEGCRRA
jgi:O-antigen ligase